MSEITSEFISDKSAACTDSCNFSGIRPAMMDLPYPPLRVKEQNHSYANLLSMDYCGSVSEMSAITQYINNENRLSLEHCGTAKILLSIAMAEMMHLQKLGSLICLLGGNAGFTAIQPNGRKRMWTPEYLTLPQHLPKMIAADIEAEQAAIHQYRTHMKMIRDEYVNTVLARIIRDEEYHIMMLSTLA